MGRLKKVGVFGSREGVDPLAVGNEIARIMSEHDRFIVVTTESKGVCTAAKVAALAAGLPVIVFEPMRKPGQVESYHVIETRMHNGTVQKVFHSDPTWADWQSACNFRSMLAVERCDVANVHWNGKSWGTAFEIDLLRWNEKPYRIIEA